MRNPFTTLNIGIAVAILAVIALVAIQTTPVQKAQAVTPSLTPTQEFIDANMGIVDEFYPGNTFHATVDLYSTDAILVKVKPGLRITGPISLSLSRNGITQTVTTTTCAEWSLPGTTPKPAVSEAGYEPLYQLLKVNLTGATKFQKNSTIHVTVLS